jgi:hypothetical protein
VGVAQPDPLVAARAAASGETVTILGYIRSIDKQTITLSLDGQPDPFLEISRSDVVAAFDDDNEDRVTLLLKSDAELGTTLTLKARDFIHFGGESQCQGCAPATGSVGPGSPPPDPTQMAMAPAGTSLTGRVPWPWCYDACDYCRRYGLYCWPCFICAIIASNSPSVAS